jgi:nucleoside-diphosphate-sugar epimerase
MRVFIAGGSGAIGRFLVPMLVEDGHHVVAMTRSAANASALEKMGAETVVGDVFDAAGLVDLVSKAAPEIVLHQLTAFGATDADPLAATIRVRTEGTRNLVAAAEAAGARRLVTQSISFICTPKGEGLTDEDTPLYLDAPDGVRPLAEAIAEMERRTLEARGMEGVVLRYGWFYGPGTNYDAESGPIPRGVRKGRSPIVGEHGGTYSFVHLEDAARATREVLASAKPGVYNIVDDEPATLATWTKEMARLLGAPEPPVMDVEAARANLGNMLTYILAEQRGASNAKARHKLGWTPRVSSWRQGFAELYGRAPSRT